MKILVTGKNGYIGKSILNKLKGYDIVGIGREDFDLSNREATKKYFKGKYFDVIIHTANVGGSRLIKDTSEVLFKNISMFNNLASMKHKYTRLISFGSGVEKNYPTDPYGLSKSIIYSYIKDYDNFHNIRIYGVFDENEWDTRFIKSNIKRYIKKEPLLIHQNKLMDFIYIDDLVTLVDHVIQNPYFKLIEATYMQPYSLLDIANLINELSSHKCEISISKSELGKMYTGSINDVKLPYIGLEKALKKVYEALN